MTRPLFVSALTVLVGGWILLNAGLRAAGLTALDPPPFAWLNDAVSLLSLFVVIVVLSTQRRDEELAQLHQQLTLQLALLGEQKTAKLIALVEALRRDHPAIPDRPSRSAGNGAAGRSRGRAGGNQREAQLMRLLSLAPSGAGLGRRGGV